MQIMCKAIAGEVTCQRRERQAFQTFVSHNLPMTIHTVLTVNYPHTLTSSPSLDILQSVTRPSRLQSTPILAEVEAGLILAICKQRSIAELGTSRRLRPQAQTDGVFTVVVDHTRRERKTSLRSYLWDEFAVYNQESVKADFVEMRMGKVRSH